MAIVFSGPGTSEDAGAAELDFLGGAEQDMFAVRREIWGSKTLLCNMRGGRGDGGRIPEVYH